MLSLQPSRVLDAHADRTLPGVLAVVLALSEALFAKMRIFRVQEFLGFAYLLSVLGLLSHIILEAAR